MKGDAPEIRDELLYASAAPGGAVAVLSPADDPADQSLPRQNEPVRRTLLRQALVDTFAQPSARAGTVWIATIAFLAVFAPFLASSFPIAMKTRSAHWEFPLFAKLFPIDVILLVTFLAVLALAFTRRLRFGHS